MVMKCHYEVLGVERDAVDDVIKKAYRKLALRLHPDKNLDNSEAATAEFRIVQQAYDVLQDSQERAWYDKHREVILQGGMGQGGDYDDKSVDVYMYFNSACYDGFHDGDEGFYSVYRKVFERIADEDYNFVEDSELSDHELPGFGDSLSDFDEIVAVFYGHWESYCTKKSYVWAEKWDTRQAPDRINRRAMEQENKKLRDAKKKERNEEIRQLVAYVKKRDKRVIANKKKLEERAAEIQRISKEKQKQHKQEQLQLMSEYREVEWSAMSNLEDKMTALEENYDDELGEEAAGYDGEEGEIDFSEDLFYCLACNKNFKTNKQQLNHNKSRKHKERVTVLREELLEDEDLDLLDQLELNSHQSDEQPLEITSSNTSNSSRKKKKKKKNKKTDLPSDDIDEPDLLTADGDEVADRINTECSNSERLTEQMNGSDSVEPALSADIPDEDACTLEDEFIHKSKRNNKKNKTQKFVVQVEEETLNCKVCLEKFNTRNKLFTHIKDSGHAALKADIAVTTEPSKKSKRKKQKS